MTRVPHERHGTVKPCWERGVDAELPYTYLITWHQLQYFIHLRTRISKYLQHRGFASLGLVRSGWGGREIDVGLHGGDVAYCASGDGIGDYVSLFADPAHYAVGVIRSRSSGSCSILKRLSMTR
jgi:hypothetical protein